MMKPDNRSAQRVMTVYKAARIGTDRADDLGLIRNISPQGVMVETQLALCEGDAVVIEIQSGNPIAGRVRWSRDGRTGIQLDHLIDLTEALRSSGPNVIFDRIRPPRFERAVDATLQGGGRHWPAVTRNISLSGALVVTGGAVDLPRHALAMVRIDGLGALSGSLRWLHGSSVGVRFEHPLPLRHFQRWLHQFREYRSADAVREAAMPVTWSHPA